MLDVLDGRAARVWAAAALAALGDAREEIDALNVFPVPDGDTGTNLYLTFEAACAAVARAARRRARCARSSRPSRAVPCSGARGNSGIITAQLLRGWADVLAEREAHGRGRGQARRCSGPTSRRGPRWPSPSRAPILSVSRAAAAAAPRPPRGRPGGRSSSAGARRGPRGARPHARAAGGAAPGRRRRRRRRGPRRAPGDPAGRRPRRGRPPAAAARGRRARAAGRRPDRLPRPRRRGPGVRGDVPARGAGRAGRRPARRLAPLGDSLVVVGGGGLWHVHVHVDDPGAAVEAGIEAGRPHRIRITHFAEQIARRRRARPRAGRRAGRVRGRARGWRGCSRRPAPSSSRTAPGRRPSTAGAPRRRPADRAPRPSSCCRTTPTRSRSPRRRRGRRPRRRRPGRRVLPTRAQVQGLAAAAVHDPARAVGRRRRPDVRRRRRGPRRRGDGRRPGRHHDGRAVPAGRRARRRPGRLRRRRQRPRAVAVEVVDRLLAGGGELVTLVRGDGRGRGPRRRRHRPPAAHPPRRRGRPCSTAARSATRCSLGVE